MADEPPACGCARVLLGGCRRRRRSRGGAPALRQGKEGLLADLRAALRHAACGLAGGRRRGRRGPGGCCDPASESFTGGPASDTNRPSAAAAGGRYSCCDSPRHRSVCGPGRVSDDPRGAGRPRKRQLDFRLREQPPAAAGVPSCRARATHGPAPSDLAAGSRAGLREGCAADPWPGLPNGCVSSVRHTASACGHSAIWRLARACGAARPNSCTEAQPPDDAVRPTSGGAGRFRRHALIARLTSRLEARDVARPEWPSAFCRAQLFAHSFRVASQ
mmetsp:Transcript_102773/g.329597  ORF Transcript_102773/g.329597 Transcript_102773/m.329597 type:complete len:275 (-) Transcript_102773:50-874(-)